jgi:hypothetical protein
MQSFRFSDTTPWSMKSRREANTERRAKKRDRDLPQRSMHDARRGTKQCFFAKDREVQTHGNRERSCEVAAATKACKSRHGVKCGSWYVSSCQPVLRPWRYAGSRNRHIPRKKSTWVRGFPGSTLRRNIRSASRTIIKSDHWLWIRLRCPVSSRCSNEIGNFPRPSSCSSSQDAQREIGCSSWSFSSPSSQDVLHAIGFHPSLGDALSRCG